MLFILGYHRPSKISIHIYIRPFFIYALCATSKATRAFCLTIIRDEIEDILVNAEANTITAFAETPKPDPKNLYRHTPLISRDKNFFAFLLMVASGSIFWAQQ